MRNNKHLIAGVLGFVIVSACVPAPPPVPNSQRPRLPPGKWTAKLTQSGGFVSVLLTVQISSDGDVAAVDQRSGRSASQTLLPETMAQLRLPITETPIPGTGTPSPSCLGCFSFELELSSNAGTKQIAADDTTIGNSGAETLIKFLARPRDAALNRQP